MKKLLLFLMVLFFVVSAVTQENNDSKKGFKTYSNSVLGFSIDIPNKWSFTEEYSSRLVNFYLKNNDEFEFIAIGLPSKTNDNSKLMAQNFIKERSGISEVKFTEIDSLVDFPLKNQKSYYFFSTMGTGEFAIKSLVLFLSPIKKGLGCMDVHCSGAKKDFDKNSELMWEVIKTIRKK